MKKYALLVAIGVFGASLIALADGNKNRVRNPGFEQGMSGWGEKVSNVTLSYDDVHEGLVSLKIDASAGKNFSRISTKPISVNDAGRSYRLSCYVKNDAAIAGDGFYIRVLQHNVGKVIGWWPQGGEGQKLFVTKEATDGWVKKEVVLTGFHPATTLVKLYMGLKGAGIVHVDDISLEIEPYNPAITSMEDFEFTADGWSISGKWQKEKPLLDIECKNSGKADAVLSLAFPSMGPDMVKRFELSGKKAEYKFTYTPPWKNGGNSFNRYVLKATLKTAGGERTKNLVLAGKDSDFARLGAPVNTKDIKKSIMGTNEHITFSAGGGRPQWAGWYDYKKLIDMMADAGIKWIRGFVGYGKDEHGNYTIQPWTLEWMSYAKSKNIKLIGQFYLVPKWTPEDVEERCRAIGEGTKGLIDVFEVGNEPQNFAGWRIRNGKGAYTGSWNGMEKDGSTAEWVKEYVKMTNIAVESLRKARPNSIIIGLGADPPVDHRMLDLGVSKEMDGIAEHPYSKRLVPERLPYGLPFEGRDGIRVGDENCSFLGIMKDALRHSKETGKERTLWLTEFGAATYWYGAPKAYDQYGQFTEHAQAIYTVRRFMQAMTMPEIKAACHYLFKDDTSNLFQAGADNCGLIRMDDSPKPAYYAVQRYASLFNNYEHDKESKVIVEETSSDAPHHKPINYVLWDDVEVHPEPGVITYAYINSELPNERQIAVWSGRAVSGEWNSTFASIRVKGWTEFNNLVAVDLITGKTFDVPVKVDGDDLIIDLVLTDNPLVIKMFKK